MKKLLWTGVLVSLLMPSLAIAQSAFDGTWKINLNKAELPKKPDVFLLQGGVYQCKTCVEGLRISKQKSLHCAQTFALNSRIAAMVTADRGSLAKIANSSRISVLASCPASRNPPSSADSSREIIRDQIVGRHSALERDL
jgi:hypothetical protein